MPPADGGTRRDPLLLLAIAAALLVLRIATGAWETARPLPTVDLVEWRAPSDADSLARATGKPVLYDFTAEWCGPCQTMQREVFADERAAELIHTMFVPVRVTDRSREDGRNPAIVDSLQHRFKVEAFPTLVVVAEGGRPIQQSGYQGSGGTVSWLRQSAVLSRMHAPRPGAAPSPDDTASAPGGPR